tara:strand:- start:40 stop:1482 length:1443 start_codon:yes stop_codon:yes gene_type:complete
MASEDIKNLIKNSVAVKAEQIGFIQDEIVIADDDKSFYDEAIVKIEKHVFEEIEDVNRSFADIQTAYQNRIDSGCRTDLFWRYVGMIPASGGQGSQDTYNFICTKLRATPYASNVGIGSTAGTPTVVELNADGSRTSHNIISEFGFDRRDLYGLKYYEEPFNEDIGDTLIGSFIGTCGYGSTEITIMNLTDNNEKYEPGQIISRCTKDGVLIINPVKITEVGIGTLTVDLEPVGIANTQATVNIIKTNVAMGDSATAPEADNSLVSFRVIADPEEFLKGRKKFKVPFKKDPFNDQIISIATKSNIGAGKSVYLVQNGVTKLQAEWNTGDIYKINNNGDFYITEPEVGPGRIYFRVGFDQKPIRFNGDDAEEGDLRTSSGGFPTPLDNFYEPCDSCSSAINDAITDALGIATAKETALTDNESVNQTLLQASNALREQRNQISLKIFGMRKILGSENDDIDTQDALGSILEDPTILDVIDD